MSQIRKVCVIGAGVMGSGIAAQVANARKKVFLLDIASTSGNKNQIVIDALEKMQRARPEPLSHPRMLEYIQIGNLQDDLDLLKDCDLIIEAVVEKLDIKHAVYSKIAPYLKKDAILASNTSTIPLANLKQNLKHGLGDRFMIMHFFNPPRYMELLELVTDNETSPDAKESAAYFAEKYLGKTIVECNDTPGFIANRVGCFLLELAARKALEKKLNFAKIDYLFQKFLYFPSTAIFGLYDLIGHDVMKLISSSLLSSLDKNDAYHKICVPNKILDQMNDRNLIGKKTGNGFYKVEKENGKKITKLLNLDSFEYEVLDSKFSETNFDDFMKTGDKYAVFVKEVIDEFYEYICSLIPNVTTRPQDIDLAMRLGYSLKFGPFELIEQKLSSNPSFSRYAKKNKTTSSGLNNSGEKEDKKTHKVFLKSKAGTLNTDIFNELIDLTSSASSEEKIIIYSSDKIFSAGADLKFLKENIENKKWDSIDNFISLGQKAMLALKYAKAHVIACPQGIALGGGMEILLHARTVIAHQNLKAGLVELGVGLVPAWGGVKEMFLRQNSKEELVLMLGNIIFQKRSPSAEYLSEYFKIKNCIVNMNMHFVEEDISELKAVPSIQSSKEVVLPKLDLASEEIFQSGLNAHELGVLEFFQSIIDMGVVNETQLLDAEREFFVRLCMMSKTLEMLRKF